VSAATEASSIYRKATRMRLWGSKAVAEALALRWSEPSSGDDDGSLGDSDLEPGSDDI
jgi:hypothetical protein